MCIRDRYVQCGDSFNETEVRSLLQKQLPDYMLPSVIEKMDRFPVTANGKIDRNKLKNRQSQGAQPARTEPANKAERDIGRMLSQTSGIRQVAVSYTHLDVYKRQGWGTCDIGNHRKHQSTDGKLRAPGRTGKV